MFPMHHLYIWCVHTHPCVHTHAYMCMPFTQERDTSWSVEAGEIDVEQALSQWWKSDLRREQQLTGAEEEAVEPKVSMLRLP